MHRADDGLPAIRSIAFGRLGASGDSRFSETDDRRSIRRGSVTDAAASRSLTARSSPAGKYPWCRFTWARATKSLADTSGWNWVAHTRPPTR